MQPRHIGGRGRGGATGDGGNSPSAILALRVVMLSKPAMRPAVAPFIMAATSFFSGGLLGFASPLRGRGKAEPLVKKVLGRFCPANRWPVFRRLVGRLGTYVARRLRSHRPYVAGLHLVL